MPNHETHHVLYRKQDGSWHVRQGFQGLMDYDLEAAEFEVNNLTREGIAVDYVIVRPVGHHFVPVETRPNQPVIPGIEVIHAN